MEIIYIKKKQSYENLFSRKLNVAAYVRVSTKRDLQLNSFESQINYYTDVINKNENWKLYKIYETNDFFYLYINKDHAFLLEKNTFTKGDISTFYIFVKRKIWFKMI